MESFFLKVYDLCNIGQNDEEKVWLQSFADHIQRHVCKDFSSQNHFDIAQEILENLSSLTNTKINDISDETDKLVDDPFDSVNDNDNDDDDSSYTPSNSFSQQQKQTLYKLFSIGDLMKREMCSGCLVSKDKVQSTVHGELSDHQHLVPIVPSFLLGYLTWNPSQLAASKAPSCGSLFLEDNSGYLPIEISNPDQNHLGQLVIIPYWTYIPSSSSNIQTGYIEAAHCIPLERNGNVVNPNSSACMSFLSLSEYKQCQRDGKQKVFNLHGKVTAISPVHNMFQTKPFLFVQLTCSKTSISSPVVVQGAHFMHWMHFLHVDSEFAFTDLRETTMNKKTKNERKILATTKVSKFMDYFPQKDDEYAKKRKTSVKEDCIRDTTTAKRLKGNDGNPRLPMATTADQDQCRAISKTGATKTISYIGVITNCFPQPNVGCYELDGKIRLFLIYQPCSRMGRGLRVGATVSLHNVHPVKKGKDLLGLCCCTLSTVRVTEYSSLDSEWKPLVFSTSPFALHGQNMSLLEYDSFTHACEKLLTKFSKTERPSRLFGYSSSRQKRSPEKLSIIDKLIKDCKSTSAILPQPRNIYQEFFDHPHTCYPSRKDSLDFPTIYTIEELISLVLEKNKNLPLQSGNDDVPSCSAEWTYQVIDSGTISENMVLLGHLKSSSTAGFMKLCDNTGKIAIHVGNDQNPCLNKTDELSSLLDYRESIIKISQFNVIIETFRNCILRRVDAEKRNRIYLTTGKASIEKLAPRTGVLQEKKSVASNDDKSYNQAKGSKTLEKQHLEDTSKKAQSNNQEIGSSSHSKYSTLDFGPQMSRDQAVTCAEVQTTCSFTCKIIFLVRHRENLQLKKKKSIHYTCAVDVKILGVWCSEVQGSVPDSTHMSVREKSVVLRLQSDSLMLYPFVFDGCFYNLTEHVPDKTQSLVMRALDNPSRTILNVTPSMTVTPVCLQNDGVTEHCNLSVMSALKTAKERFLCSDADKLQSIEEILNDVSIKPTDKPSKSDMKQTNFQGVIVLRELRESDACAQLLPGNNIMVPRFGALEESRVHQLELGFGYLGNKTLFLRVRDFGSPNTLDVYVDLNTAPYIDGLLPGSLITCRRFLRKLSKKGNVYCSYDACSSLTVQSVAERDDTPSTVTHPQQHQASNMATVPRRFLVDLVSSETSGRRIQTISRIRCRLTSVQRLWMRWDCSRCSHVIVREECPQGCRSDAPFRFCAEARCLVEDGTAEAIVHLSDDELIFFLLKLSNTEVSKLKSLALSLGELLYQRYSYGYDGNQKNDNANVMSKQIEANRMLADRCCSNQIKRSIVLYCKAVGSFSKKTDSANQEYDTRPIIINQTEHSTFVLPKLQLKAVNMTDVNYTEEINHLLDAVKTL